MGIVGSSLDKLCCDATPTVEGDKQSMHVSGDDGNSSQVEVPGNAALPEALPPVIQAGSLGGVDPDSKDEPSTPPAGRGSVHHADVGVSSDAVPAKLQENESLLKRARFISIDMRVMFSHDCDYVHPSTGEVKAMPLEKNAFHGESSRKVITAPHLSNEGSTEISPKVLRGAAAIVEQAKRMAIETAKEPDDMTHDGWEGPNGKDALGELMSVYNEDRDVYVALDCLNEDMLSLLKKEPLVMRAPAPAKVYGDLHGQFRDMLLFLHHYGFPSKSGSSFIFNGDWVDRGQHQIETIALVYALKLTFPEQVFLVRGNHEDASVNEHMRKHGFRHVMCETFKHRVRHEDGQSLWGKFTKTFNWLPLAVVIGGRLLVVHGGIGNGEWDIKTLEGMKDEKELRPITHEAMKSNDMVYNILWSDPVDEDRPDSFGVHESPRDHNAGILHQFGIDITKKFCDANNIAMVIRSHQSERKGAGYEIMHDGMLVTVFSARDYEGNKNDGAILSVEEYRDEDEEHRDEKGERDDLSEPPPPPPMLVVRPQQIWSHKKTKHRPIES